MDDAVAARLELLKQHRQCQCSARLSAATRRVLALAACIGHAFDLRALTTIAEQAPAHTARSTIKGLTLSRLPTNSGSMT